MKKTLALVPAIALGIPSAALAQATGPDFSALTGAIDFTTVQTALLSVGALVVGLALVTMGIRKIVAMARRG